MHGKVVRLTEYKTGKSVPPDQRSCSLSMGYQYPYLVLLFIVNSDTLSLLYIHLSVAFSKIIKWMSLRFLHLFFPLVNHSHFCFRSLDFIGFSIGGMN